MSVKRRTTVAVYWHNGLCHEVVYYPTKGYVLRCNVEPVEIVRVGPKNNPTTCLQCIGKD